jgi:hypothetical protein
MQSDVLGLSAYASRAAPFHKVFKKDRDVARVN